MFDSIPRWSNRAERIRPNAATTADSRTKTPVGIASISPHDSINKSNSNNNINDDDDNNNKINNNNKNNNNIKK